MVSGASISNIFYQGKLVVTSMFSVIIFAIWGAIGGGSLYPYLIKGTTKSQTFSKWISTFNFDNLIYWVLPFLLFGAIVYKVLSGQGKFERTTLEYRKKKMLRFKKNFQTTNMN